MEEYNADIDVQRVKPRWHSEEEYLMAVYEVQLRQEKVYNLNQRLHQKFPLRSFVAIKSHRRDANYRKLVEDLLRNQNRDPAEGGNGNQDEQSGNVDVQDPNPANKRAETCEEIRKLTFKPPPKSYQACRLWETAKRFLTDLATLLNRLAKAPLKPQQRLVALRFYLIPRLVHRLVLGPVSAKMLLKLDRSIRAAVRHWLNLPHDVTLGFLYAPVPVGGLGILCLRTTIPGMRIKRLNGLLHSSHYPCAAAATTETMIKASRQTESLAHFRGEVLQSSKASAKYWTKQLHRSFDGMPLRHCTNAVGSTAWLGEGTTFLSGREFIKLVKFHISAMPSLTRLKRGQNVPVTCRAGCDARESLGHILQQCHRTHHQRIERHDGIVRYLASRLKEKGWSVLQEPHYRTSQGTKIPDLVIHRDQQSVVLDVQVVGTRVALSDAYEMKRNKYLFPELTKQVNPHSSPIVAAVTMSYRGTWARESVNILTDVGLGRNDLKMLSIRCMQGGLRAFSVHQKSTVVRPHRQ
ncbi:hypothetical protein HPB51_006754 [Rhipicephalus microplus]|uniref:Reverse transcriptase n=1 Tax=Rhipicephalus microplus TaxID=6941 RepID=A0A9J6E7R3_RHIMP|nr:hypothetical protein HPB51_006754 [Rhipicephalus microplus]